MAESVLEPFRVWQLRDVPGFAELLAAVAFDDVGKGRRGTLVTRREPDGVPIVRTTTSYRAPARAFRDVHAALARPIETALACAFNHALVEHYTRAYATMKQHSDQALDLADASWIAVYSCYRDPARPSRRLVVKAKGAATTFEIPLDHGSVVAFSLATNRLFTHAITLRAQAADNDWLGITFRTSKTRLQFDDGQPRLANGALLTLADDDQRREFLQLRRRENAETTFTYPPLSYTLSEGDLRPPVTG